MSKAQMNSPGDNAEVRVTPEIAAEAGVWIAMLHGPNRSPKMERDFLEWQAKSAAHRKAFEATTDVWEAVRGIKLSDAYASASARASAKARAGDGGGYRWQPRRSRWPLFLLLPLMAVSVVFLFRPPGGDLYETRIGNQQQITLDDGSRMTLNTDTRVRVRLGAEHRSVTVLQGEALFEVAKDPARPFVVRAGGSEVVAVGTVFAVRLAEGAQQRPETLAVTLVEGKVIVRPDVDAKSDGLAPAAPVQMNAGDRVRLTHTSLGTASPPQEQRDRPQVEQVLAWKRSMVDLDNMTLTDAVAEMNRYSRTPIVLVGDASLSKLRVSGMYKTGDNASFARAVVTVHGLQLDRRDGRLELSLPH